MFYNAFDFYKYLNDLTRGDCSLNDLVRNKLVNREVISGYVDVYGDKALDMIKFFDHFYRDRDRLYMEYCWYLGRVGVQIPFKLAVEFLKDPENIFGKGTQPSYAFEFDYFLRELGHYVREKTSSFVEKIKQEQLELERLFFKKEQEALELERKKEQEQLKLERKKEQEALELERKKEQEQLKLERKKEQEQLEKGKEGNEKKLKQNKIDTIVSYFFNRNLN